MFSIDLNEILVLGGKLATDLKFNLSKVQKTDYLINVYACNLKSQYLDYMNVSHIDKKKTFRQVASFTKMDIEYRLFCIRLLQIYIVKRLQAPMRTED